MEQNMSPQAYEQWCRSLLGREWEIYWEQEADATADTTAKEAGVDSNNDLDNNDGDEAYDADWYDGRVLAYQNGVFQIKFMGDETLYVMRLEPRIVRPSARAWIKRTKALLDLTEQQLPHTTATLQEIPEMETNWNSISVQYPFLPNSNNNNTNKINNTMGPACESIQDRVRIRKLHRLVADQIYLRAKLSPIPNFDEEEDEDDEVPAEDYVNYLMKCLEWIARACIWYEQEAWSIARQVLCTKAKHQGATTMLNMTQTVPPQPASGVAPISYQSMTSSPFGHPVVMTPQLQHFMWQQEQQQQQHQQQQQMKLWMQQQQQVLLQQQQQQQQQIHLQQAGIHIPQQAHPSTNSLGDATNVIAEQHRIWQQQEQQQTSNLPGDRNEHVSFKAEDHVERTVKETKVAVEDLARCIRRGYIILSFLVHLDTSPAAIPITKPTNSPATPPPQKQRSKRRQSPASGRGAKRDATYVAMSMGDPTRQHQGKGIVEAEQFFHDESFTGDIHSLNISVSSFVPLHQNCNSSHRWYNHLLCKALANLLQESWDPIMGWIHRANELLVRDEKATDQIKSSTDISRNDSVGGNDDDSTRIPNFYSVHNIDTCIGQSSSNMVLNKIDLSLWIKKLEMKLDSISKFEIDAWTIIQKYADESCMEETPIDGEPIDSVVFQLVALQERAATSDSHLINMEPLGRLSNTLTRKVIDNAIRVREWVVDLHHAEKYRERILFVQNVIGRSPTLPSIQEVPDKVAERIAAGSSSAITSASSKFNKLMIRLPTLSSAAYAHSGTIQHCEQLLTGGAGIGDINSSFPNPRAVDGVTKILEELKKLPYLSTVEEKFSARLDLLRWNELVSKSFLLDSSKKPSFDELEQRASHLSSIMERKDVSTYLSRNVDVENEIRAFAKADVGIVCHNTEPRIRSMYVAASEWKKKADSILQALRSYDNAIVRESMVDINSARGCAMVDSKRIEDLVEEYDSLGVNMSPKRDLLANVLDNARKWASRVGSAIEESQTLADCSEGILLAQESRPNGVLIDPARHVIDSWVEVMDWRDRLTSGLLDLTQKVSKINDQNSGVEVSTPSLSDWVESAIYPLILEGIEILELYDVTDMSGTKPAMLTGETEEEKRAMINYLKTSYKQVRMISVNKLQSNLGGISILKMILDVELDQKSSYPLFFSAFLLWRIRILRFVSSLQEPGSVNSPPSLGKAKYLNKLKPMLRLVGSDDYITVERMAEINIITQRLLMIDIRAFENKIEDGDRLEKKATQCLFESRDIRDAYYNQESLKENIASIKTLHSEFRARRASGCELILNVTLEEKLDKRVKDLSWMTRTLSFPLLHGDDLLPLGGASNTDDMDTNPLQDPSAATNGITRDSRIPWDILVNLYEKQPVYADKDGSAHEDAVTGDFILVCFRVKEIYEKAHNWQEMVSSCIPLSFRGIKLRGKANSGLDANSSVSETNCFVEIRQLENLTCAPILQKVQMPREDAVCEVLDQAREMKAKLCQLLEVDFESGDDKSALPEAESLIGRHGEFYLYRLTGGSSYSALQLAIKDTAAFADALLVNTSEKAAFEWVFRVFSWLEKLKSSVKENKAAVCTLTIRYTDARSLLDSGSLLFLEVCEEIRKVLSSHKVYLSSNKQTEKLNVVIGKGGAQQSLGGIIIKWATFLFECLKGDLSSVDKWTQDTIKGMHGADSFISEVEDSEQANIETIQELSELSLLAEFIRVSKRLDKFCMQAVNDFIVSPEEHIYASLCDKKKSLENLFSEGRIADDNGSQHLYEEEKESVMQIICKRRYEDAICVVEDRTFLLDSLVNRKRQRQIGKVNRKSQELGSVLDESSGYREKSRAFLEKSFFKGIDMLDVSEDLPLYGSALSFCAMKAWELEVAVYNEFCSSDATKKMSPEYRAKIRSLRHNLEDTKNPTLCARVLLGEILILDLVKMSSADMASPEVKRIREQVEEEAKRNVVLGPGQQKPSSTVSNLPASANLEVKDGTADGVNDTVSAVTTVSKPDKSNQKKVVPGKLPTSMSIDLSDEKHDDKAILASSVSQSFSEVIPLACPVKLSPQTTQQPRRAPPAPPSLASAAFSSHMSSVDDSLSGRKISSVVGQQTFTVSISALRLKFSTCLLLEEQGTQYAFDGFLPEQLTDKGRLPTEEFTKFVSGKMSGKRWTLVVLRLVNIHDEHSYDKFRKEYEKKNRIAMFAAGNETKLFLVTPKFLKAVSHLHRDGFASTTSTYAVVLTREKLRMF